MSASSIRESGSAPAPEPAGWYPLLAFVASVAGMTALVALADLRGVALSPLTWYLARASGLTLYALLWLSVVTGLGITTRLLDRLGGRGTIYSIHRFVTELGAAALALHLMSLAADPTVSFGARELLVPFAASWREPWTGLGVVAAWLGIVVASSFGLRRWTGYRAWRALHWLSFPLYVTALGHGLGAGTDARAAWATALYLVTSGAVVWLIGYRLLTWRSRDRSLAPRSRPGPLDRLAAAPAAGELRGADADPGR